MPSTHPQTRAAARAVHARHVAAGTDKRCSRCRSWKPRDGGFNRNRTKADGLQSHCRECEAITEQRRRTGRGVLTPAELERRAAAQRHVPDLPAQQRAEMAAQAAAIHAWAAEPRRPICGRF